MLTASTLFFIRTNAQGQSLEIPMTCVNASLFAVNESGGLVMKPFSDFVSPATLTTTLGGYVTNATLGSYSTTAAMSSAIAAAVPGSQRLLEKRDNFTVFLTGGSTTTVTPTSAITVVSANVVSGVTATLNIAGGTVGDLVAVNYFPKTGNVLRGNLTINFDGVTGLSLSASTSDSPEQIFITRVRDDATQAASPNWVVTGRFRDGKPILASHSFTQGAQDAGFVVCQQQAPRYAIQFTDVKPPDGTKLTVEINGSPFGAYEFAETNGSITPGYAWVDIGAAYDAHSIAAAFIAASGATLSASAYGGISYSPGSAVVIYAENFAFGSANTINVSLTGAGSTMSIVSQEGGNNGLTGGGSEYLVASGAAISGIASALVIFGSEDITGGPDVPVPFWINDILAGTIPTGQSSGVKQLGEFMSTYARSHLLNSPGVLKFYCPSTPATGRLQVIVQPGNIPTTLNH